MNRKLKAIVAACLASLCQPCGIMYAEDIEVSRAIILKEVNINTPYMTDTLDVKGKTFDWDNILKLNAPTGKVKLTGSEEYLSYGSALETGKENATLRHIYFTVDASSYTPANIEVKGISRYKVYVDGVENSSLKAFNPSRHSVVLSVITTPDVTDTLRIKIVGDTLNALTINVGGNRPYDMQDMLNGLRPYHIRISPSGKMLITTYSDTDLHGKIAYHTIITEISSGRVLYRANEYEDIRWIPDNEVCFITRKENGNRTLIELNPATSAQRTLAYNLPDGSITFSPNADYAIINVEDKANAPYQEGLKVLIEPDDRMPSWRNRSNLFKYDFATSTITQLTFGYKAASVQDISSDGSKILFSTGERRLTRRPFYLTSLYEMNTKTLKVDTLLTDTGYVETFMYDPRNATRILVKASPESFGGIGNVVTNGKIPSRYEEELYLFIPGEGVTPLTKDFAPSVGRTFWSKADGNVYFTANDKDRVTLFRLDPARGSITSIPLGSMNVISAFTMAENSLDLVYHGHWDRGARNIYHTNLQKFSAKKANTEVKRIGEIDFDQYLAGVDIAECRDWNFLSARGDSIYGRFYLPRNFDSSRKYPMIVYYYSGCVPTERMFEFRYPLQIFAAQGYIVYVLQPSGTIGFGQDFSALHVNAWGINTADDIIEGTTLFAKAHDFVDSTKIGCIGASYGGFMTQYLISHSDIFAAAISHAGISNIASYWGGGYWGYSYSEAASADSYPWNNQDLYVKQSPLFNADKIQTPLLLLHGSADTNVPTTESIQMYTALKLLGREVELIEVEGENHVIMDYEKRIAWQNAIFAWFARWLKDEPQWWKANFVNGLNKK